MKPVYQTKFGLGQGDCLNAAVASVLECGLDDIPDFAAAGDGEWFERLYSWCSSRGIGLICASPKDVATVAIANIYCVLIHQVVGVPQENHAVVGQIVRTPSADDKWAWECNEVFDPARHRHKMGELEHIIILVPLPSVPAEIESTEPKEPS